MKNIYKNLVNCSILGASLLLGATACSDDHFDIKDQSGAGEGYSTIWQSMLANDELSDVREILKVTRVMKDEKDDKATLTYDKWLDQPMSITAWFPKNGTFDKQYYLDILAKAEQLAVDSTEAVALRTEYQVVNQFVKNHIALFNYGNTSTDQRVRLLNSKHCVFGAGFSTFNNVALIPSFTTHNGNGSLYVLDGVSPFAHNIYDMMSSDEMFSTVYSIISDPAIDKEVFWPEGSTQGAVNEKGEIVYVDSVYLNTNEMLNSAHALIKSEDSIYVAMIPSNSAWQGSFDVVRPLYKYGRSYNYDWDETKFTKTGVNSLKFDTDSLGDVNTSAAIIESMFFNPSAFRGIEKTDSAAVINYMVYQADSLISTNGIVYYNENAGTGLANPLFAGLTPIKASNGYVFSVDQNRIKPEYSFLPRRIVRPGNILASVAGCRSENGEFTKLTLENWAKDSVSGTVEDDSYHYFAMDGNNTLRIRMRLNNLPAGHYKISAQMLPNRINTFNIRYEDDGVTPKVEEPQFNAKLMGDDLKPFKHGESKNLTVNQDSVANVVLFDDIFMSKSYSDLPSGYETFPILELSMTSTQKRNGNCDALSIAKIIIEPIRD